MQKDNDKKKLTEVDGCLDFQKNYHEILGGPDFLSH